MELEYAEQYLNKLEMLPTKALIQKLLLLSDDGLDVTSENVRYYINYFNDIIFF